MINDIGATGELSLRVSVATLGRVLFKNPSDGELMLALERKATLHKTQNGPVVEVKSQPFGGAIRILDLMKLHELIVNFHFDSKQSRSEQDFRIFIRPSAWSMIREFCIQHISRDADPILETDPERELAEEFADTLKISLKPEQYVCTPIATLVENQPSPTENFYTKGTLTVRVYRVFEAYITDSSLAHAMLKNSEGVSHQSLCELALKDSKKGGNGWANAILALPLKRITDHYLGVPTNERNAATLFEKNLLDDTVSAILEGIAVPKYQRL